MEPLPMAASEGPGAHSAVSLLKRTEPRPPQETKGVPLLLRPMVLSWGWGSCGLQCPNCSTVSICTELFGLSPSRSARAPGARPLLHVPVYESSSVVFVKLSLLA